MFKLAMDSGSPNAYLGLAAGLLAVIWLVSIGPVGHSWRFRPVSGQPQFSEGQQLSSAPDDCICNRAPSTPASPWTPRAAPPPPAVAEGGAAPSPQAQLHWFAAHGYQLPQTCEKHADLYTNVFNDLRPWRGRGITQADLDACAPIARGNASDYLHGTPGGIKFRLLVHSNEVFITSGGLRRGTDGHDLEGLEYYMISQIADAARRFGLPNMEFAVGFGDLPHIRGPEAGGGLCPLMVYCKDPGAFDIAIPDGQFHQYTYDEWLERNRNDGGGVPWEEKEGKVVGRWSGYCAGAPQTDRYGHTEECVRTAYFNRSRDRQDEQLLSFHEGGMSLEEQRKFKYTLNLDGIGCSGRLQKLMATGQTILKQDSNLTEYFYAALQPWVHYVPTGWNGIAEADWAVRFLRENDEMARRIGQNAQHFAQQHLNEEGRLCYIKVLFEEMKKLMRQEPPAPQDLPYTISYEEEVKQFVNIENSHMAIGKV